MIMAREWKKIANGVYAVGPKKVIYFRMMVAGRREMEKSPLQGIAAVNSKGKITPELQKLALGFRMRLLNRDYYSQNDNAKKHVPTFREFLDKYEEIAAEERIKNRQPGERATQTAINSFSILVEDCGFKWTEPITKLTTSAVDHFIVRKIKEGLEPVSAWSYASSARSTRAKWALPYYRELNWDVPVFEMPVRKDKKPPRYQRPSKEVLEAVEKWYWDLTDKVFSRGTEPANQDKGNCAEPANQDKGNCAEPANQDPGSCAVRGKEPTRVDYEIWWAATAMLRFAMRNSCAERISPRNFFEREGIHYLRWLPHKTERTQRWVTWSVHPDFMEKINKVIEALDLDEDDHILDHPRMRFERLNSEVRKIHDWFKEKEKAAYELRKICIDNLFHKLGAEKTSALTGEDMKTIAYFYADVTIADMEPIRFDKLF